LVMVILSFLGAMGAGYGVFAAVMALVAGGCLMESVIGRRDMAIRIRRWENSWSCLHCGRSFMSVESGVRGHDAECVKKTRAA
jgi:hypothetical protein